MFNIKDKTSFKMGYEILATLEANEQGNPAMTNNLIPQLKKELRHYAHRDNLDDVGMGFMVERRIVKEYGIDGYIELVSIPAVFETVSEADEFFRDFIYLRAYLSVYDCTGKPFTGWYKLFKRNNQFYAYHRIAFDV